ncbi:MAG: erythromycin esterase family protein, partial [Myxococcales bacterium]|nr:erythromycin esterase family protein [Myxococcales bacterium]
MSMHFGSMVVASLVAAVLGLGCGEASPAMGGGGTAASGGGGDGGAGGAEPVAVWPLSGVDFDAPSDDLLPFAALVAEASVIGIGESVHTTGGELRMRARLIRYLVEAEGIRVIVLENEWEETERTVAPHVDACSGTAEEAAMGLNPVWWDVSTPRLLAWLCAYNQTHADDPVRVLGMDIRQAWYDHPAVVSYLEAVAPADAPSVADGTSTCLGVGHASREDFFADPLVQAYFSGGAPLPEADHQA